MKEKKANGQSPGSISEFILAKETLFFRENILEDIDVTGLGPVPNTLMKANVVTEPAIEWPEIIDCRGGVIFGRHN